MWWRLAAVMIGLALATPGAAFVGAAGKPDLKLDFVGVAPTDARALEFRLTNVGDGPASAGAAHAETLSPTPGNVVQPNYPAVEPGKSISFFYFLTEPCNAHVVKAGVSATADGEENYDNNFFQAQVCPELVVAAPIEVGPSPHRITPEHRRPGTHTRAFAPSAIRGGERGFREGASCPFGSPDTAGLVGWEQIEEGFFGAGILPCTMALAYQTAVAFDLGLLDDVPNKTITRAVLTFTETPQRWTSGGGDPRDVRGCVTTLAYATTDWARQPANGAFFPNEPFTSKLPFGDQEWYVREEVDQWVRGARPNHGFVLRSHREADRGDDDDSCLSLVSDIKLTITWRVPN